MVHRWNTTQQWVISKGPAHPALVVLQLEKRISELLGEQVWRESGLSAGADIDDLQQRVAVLEHEVADLNRIVEERTQELTAARAANRELMIGLNARRPT